MIPYCLIVYVLLSNTSRRYCKRRESKVTWIKLRHECNSDPLFFRCSLGKQDLTCTGVNFKAFHKPVPHVHLCGMAQCGLVHILKISARGRRPALWCALEVSTFFACAYSRFECAAGRIFGVTCFDSENGTVEVAMEIAFEGHLTVEW